MTRCFKCDETCEIKKHRAFNYTGVNLNNIVLLNLEVEVCKGCDTKTPLLRNVKKLHNAIGAAIALQKVHLSGADIRFLRRRDGFSIGEWVKRLEIAEGTYTKWENGYRPVTPQADKLARISFLNALKQQDPENVRLAEHLDAVLTLRIERRKEFVVAIDAENPEAPAKYLPHDSTLFAEPTTSFVEARTLPFEPMVTVKIVRGHSSAMTATLNQEPALCG